MDGGAKVRRTVGCGTTRGGWSVRCETWTGLMTYIGGVIEICIEEDEKRIEWLLWHYLSSRKANMC